MSLVMQMALGYWGMSDVLHGYFLARTSMMREMDFGAVADGYDLENTMMSEFRRFAARRSPSFRAHRATARRYQRSSAADPRASRPSPGWSRVA